MKAMQIKGYGDVEENVALAEIPKPEIKENQVLIEVRAAGVNPVDYKIVKGVMKKLRPLSFPAPIGYDVSGVVTEAGGAVKNLSVGDEVYARVPSNGPGTFAEYAAVDASVVVRKPENLSFTEAAGIPLAGLTTLESLALAGLKKGDRVLIHAGSGGVGSFAVQYAKALGAEVYTTTSTTNVEWVRKLGAHRVIDYKKENWLDVVKDADIVFDTLGGSYTADSFKVLKKGGFVVSVSGPIDGETAASWGLPPFVQFVLKMRRRNITRMMKEKSAGYRFYLLTPKGESLEKISKMIRADQIRPVVDRIFTLEQGVEALRYVETGRAKGKVIIQVR